jgi:predicted nucleic acid-binding protein
LWLIRQLWLSLRMSAGHALFAPAHLDVEVVPAPRTMSWGNPAFVAAVQSALEHLAGLPVRRMALAEQLRATLITCDVRLASAPGAKCTFDVIS